MFNFSLAFYLCWYLFVNGSFRRTSDSLNASMILLKRWPSTMRIPSSIISTLIGASCPSLKSWTYPKILISVGQVVLDSFTSYPVAWNFICCSPCFAQVWLMPMKFCWCFPITWCLALAIPTTSKCLKCCWIYGRHLLLTGNVSPLINGFFLLTVSWLFFSF